MDGEEFKVRGREMVDYIVSYLEDIETRRVTPAIEPGYLSRLLPSTPPQEPEPWEHVMKEIIQICHTPEYVEKKSMLNY